MTTPTEDLRRRLYAGEALTSQQVADEYGVSRSLLQTTIATLAKNEGVKFRRTLVPNAGRGGGVKSYRISSPRPDKALRGTWGKGAGVARIGNRGGRAVANGHAPAPAVRAAVNGKPAGVGHPVPALGDSVTVFLLALTEDGRVNVGLRAGDQTWLTTVDGFSVT